jgi:hypothetical protein
MRTRHVGLLVCLPLLACTPRDAPSPGAQPVASASALATLQAQANAPRSASREIPGVVVPQRTGFVIDGVLDEPGWADAAATGPFGSAGDGARVDGSPVHAAALLAADEHHLYFAIWVADEAAESPNARDARDPHIWATASGVELMLQPGDPGDNTHYYEVQVDVAEAVWDTQFDDYNRPITGEGDARQFGRQDWDAALNRRVTRHDGGYVVEAALPWQAIGSDRVAVPPAAGDVWRANLYSFRDGQRHSLAWSPLHGEGNFHRSARFGRLTFGAVP